MSGGIITYSTSAEAKTFFHNKNRMYANVYIKRVEGLFYGIGDIEYFSEIGIKLENIKEDLRIFTEGEVDLSYLAIFTGYGGFLLVAIVLMAGVYSLIRLEFIFAVILIGLAVFAFIFLYKVSILFENYFSNMAIKRGWIDFSRPPPKKVNQMDLQNNSNIQNKRLYNENILTFVLTKNFLTISMLQRRFSMSWSYGEKLIQQLQSIGFVGEKQKDGSFPVLKKFTPDGKVVNRN